MLLLILSIAVQLALIVHCIKTGRNWLWILALALPGIALFGCIAYVIVEILPELMGSRTARRTTRNLGRILNPTGNLRRREEEARVTGNVDSITRYADELTAVGRYDDAIAQYRKALTGLYEHDPTIMLGLARAQFEKGEPAAARQTLDDLIRLNPDFRSPEGHLLYARALEGEGNYERALEEYKALAHSYPGAEAGVRYAQLLKAQGHHEEARKVAQEMLDEARVAPAHYRRIQRNWLDIAERLAAR